MRNGDGGGGGSIWQLEQRISEQLLAWSAGSVVMGLLLRRPGASHTAHSLGLQALAWGAVDGAIALVGREVSLRKARLPDAFTPAVQRQEREGLRRLLLVNVALDVMYVLGGGVLLRLKKVHRSTYGHGLGVLIQGAFLLVFDASHAYQLKN